MSIWAQVFGGFLATAGGVGVALFQNHLRRNEERRDHELQALAELARDLAAPLVQLERCLGSDGIWVGTVRQLPRIGSWILDPAGPEAPLNWDGVAELLVGVEQRWQESWRVRVNDPTIRERYRSMQTAAIQVARRDVVEVRSAALQLRTAIDDLLAAIGARLQGSR